MRQASLSHFLLGRISLGVYRENNMFNETIQARHPHWRIIISKESTMARVIMLYPRYIQRLEYGKSDCNNDDRLIRLRQKS